MCHFTITHKQTNINEADQCSNIQYLKLYTITHTNTCTYILRCAIPIVFKLYGEVNSVGLGIYKTLLARKLSKPEDARYRPKHVVFQLLINTII